jgi:hypothetical protein
MSPTRNTNRTFEFESGAIQAHARTNQNRWTA